MRDDQEEDIPTGEKPIAPSACQDDGPAPRRGVLLFEIVVAVLHCISCSLLLDAFDFAAEDARGHEQQHEDHDADRHHVSPTRCRRIAA